MAGGADLRFRNLLEVAKLPVGEARALEVAQHAAISRVVGAEGVGDPLLFHRDQLGQLLQEPGIDPRRLVQLLDRDLRDQGALDLEEALGRGPADRGEQRLAVDRVEAVVDRPIPDHPPCPSRLEATEALLQRLLEGAPDRHRLADRLHLGGQPRFGGGELLEGEARDLHHHVVEHRLEGGRGRLGDVVRQLVEGVADGELRADPRDREAGGLGGERR